MAKHKATTTRKTMGTKDHAEAKKGVEAPGEH